eukprot:319964_1
MAEAYPKQHGNLYLNKIVKKKYRHQAPRNRLWRDKLFCCMRCCYKPVVLRHEKQFNSSRRRNVLKTKYHYKYSGDYFWNEDSMEHIDDTLTEEDNDIANQYANNWLCDYVEQTLTQQSPKDINHECNSHILKEINHRVNEPNIFDLLATHKDNIVFQSKIKKLKQRLLNAIAPYIQLLYDTKDNVTSEIKCMIKPLWIKKLNLTKLKLIKLDNPQKWIYATKQLYISKAQISNKSHAICKNDALLNHSDKDLLLTGYCQQNMYTKLPLDIVQLCSRFCGIISKLLPFSNIHDSNWIDMRQYIWTRSTRLACTNNVSPVYSVFYNDISIIGISLSKDEMEYNDISIISSKDEIKYT